MGAICKHLPILVQDPYGNYVVQYALDLRDDEMNGWITERLLGNLCVLSRSKFGSNVVEKCLQIAPSYHKTLMIQELLSSGGEQLGVLLLDVFANYVVQRALSVAEEPLFSQLIEAVRPSLPQIRAGGTSAGRRIVQKLVKKYPMLDDQDGHQFSVGGTTTQNGGGTSIRNPDGAGSAVPWKGGGGSGNKNNGYGNGHGDNGYGYGYGGGNNNGYGNNGYGNGSNGQPWGHRGGGQQQRERGQGGHGPKPAARSQVRQKGPGGPGFRGPGHTHSGFGSEKWLVGG